MPWKKKSELQTRRCHSCECLFEAEKEDFLCPECYQSLKDEVHSDGLGWIGWFIIIGGIAWALFAWYVWSE